MKKNIRRQKETAEEKKRKMLRCRHLKEMQEIMYKNLKKQEVYELLGKHR